MSPEMINEEVKFTPESDVWAVGCILVEILALKPAFSGSNLLAIAKKVDRFSSVLLSSFNYLLVLVIHVRGRIIYQN